jgi:nuclear RNA export factor
VYIVDDDPSLIEEGTGKSTVDALRSFLSRRWDANTKYLNLEAIADDAILQDAGIELPGSEDSSKVGGALMKLAGEMFPDVSQKWM